MDAWVKYTIAVPSISYGLLVIDGDGPAIAWVVAGVALLVSGMVIGMIWQGDDSL